MNKCRNNHYDPKQFGMVSSWIKLFKDWRSRIEGYYTEEDSKSILAAIDSGTFNRAYGKTDIRNVLTNRNPLTNAKEVDNLKAQYITMKTGRTGGDFDNMSRAFKMQLIERVLLDKDYRRIEVDKTLSDDITVLNHNLYDYKIELIKELYNALHPGSQFDYTYDGKNGFTKLINTTLAEYESRRLSNPQLDSLWDTYFKLCFFDQLLSDFDGFVDLKQEFKTSSLKSMDMYISVKPYVAYDTSYNPNEFASAEQYASEVLKTLLDYFREYNATGEQGYDSIGFKGFNYAVTRLCEWVESGNDSVLKDELDRGNNINWGLLIQKFIEAKNRKGDDEVIKKLKGIQMIFNVPTLDSTIREMLNEQKERVVRYQFESYRFMWDPGLKRNVLVPLRVEDGITDRQKGVIAKAIRVNVNRFRKNPTEYLEFLDLHGIEYDSKKNKFILKNFLKGNGGNLELEVKSHEQKTYIFSPLQSRTGNDVDEQKVRDLVNDLFGFYVTDNFKSIFDTEGFNGHNMWDTWGESIMRTLAASLTGENTLSDYTYRKNGTELEFKGTSYSDLAIPAAFLSIMNGFSKITVTKNGLGNDLPIYQQVSAIHKSREMLRKALSNYENIRSGNHNELGTRQTIFDNNILKPNLYGYSPIGAIFVKSDFDYDGTNKNSAQMNFRELSHLAILKSYYHNLYHNDGKITLQTTCLSDKHTHFMVQFITKNIIINHPNLIGSQNLQNVLTGAGSLHAADRQLYSQVLLDEIKSRRDAKTRVEVVNFYNRYAAIKELGLKPDASTKMSYDELNARLKSLNDALNKYSKKAVIYTLCKNANDSNGIDYLPEADLIELDGKVWINETMYHNFQIYCNPDSSAFMNRIEQQMMLHAKFMFDNHFVLDGTLDPDVLRIINSFKASDALNKTNESDNWVDPISNVIKPFRLFNKATGEEIIPTYISANYESQFDSNLVRVELNPVLNSHFYADVLLSTSFNDIVFGEDYGVDGKALKAIAKDVKKARDEQIELVSELAQLNQDYLDAKDSFTKQHIQVSINSIQNKLAKINETLQKWNYYSPEFRKTMEASRLNMHYKRTVHGGATYTPLLQNTKWGVAPKVKVAAYWDTKDPKFSITGDIDEFTSQDGGGWSHPVMSRLTNRSYVDGAVGKNKKTIFSFVDPETGVLTLIKWAEYEITNAVRRDSPLDENHASSELMYKKMSSIDITDAVNWNTFDVTKYYNRAEQKAVPGVTRTKAIYRKDITTGQHFMLYRIENNGQTFTPIWQEVNERGMAIPGKSPERGKTVLIKTLYDLDQIFGGAWVEEVNEQGWLDWSEAQNDILYTIVCDNNLKDKFIGYSINASAIKSGMRNVNAANSFFANNPDELLWFEISTRYGGAQMNADHILSEAEVTEMSQMISALIQAGLKTGTVDKVYQFIGRVAAESLGNLSQWINSDDDELKVYKWLGESVARSLDSGQGDTLGLAGAFIGRANKSFKDTGLKTRIPFSANTVKGIFEASVTSYINSKAIHRTFPGGGFVQNPTYDVKPRYNFGKASYSYTELADQILKYNKEHNTDLTAEYVITNRDCFRNPITKKIVFNNPFINELSSDERTSLDIDDTIIVWKDTDLDGKLKLKDGMQVVRLTEFADFDYWRNLSPEYHVAKWETRPKNLLGSRTFFNVGKKRFSLYDLDSTRVSIYASILLDDQSIRSESISFLLDYIINNSELLDYLKLPENLDLGTIKNLIGQARITDDSELTKTIKAYLEPLLLEKDNLKTLKKYSTWQSKEDLKQLSKIQSDRFGYFRTQMAFNTSETEVMVSDINTESSEILIGLADAKAFGVERTQDFQLIESQKEDFFKNKLQLITQLPPSKSVNRDKYDIVAYKADGSPTLVLIGELHDSQPDLNGMIINTNYVISEDGNVYYNNESLGLAFGKSFYKYIGDDGIEYDVLYCDTLSDFEQFNKSNQLYSNTVDNYTLLNAKLFSKLRTGIANTNVERLNEAERQRQQSKINILAKQKYYAWEAYKKGIATRIPAQSMQSFTSVKVVGFTNDNITNVYISTMLAFLQGSDFDIDKLYIMRYGVTPDGRLATYSNLDSEFNPEKCLDLPVPKGRKFEVIRGNRTFYDSMNDPTIPYIQLHRGGVKALVDILDKVQDIRDKRITIFIDDSNAISDEVVSDFKKDMLNPERLEERIISEEQWEYWLNKHEQTKREGNVKQIALRNVVVRGILDVITDPSTQYNLQIPIAMTEQRAAANSSKMGKDEAVLTADNPSAKIMMQIQNMVGREVIGIGAASLKAFFAASTYYNKKVEKLSKLLSEHANGKINNSQIFNTIKDLVFNGKFSTSEDRRLITFANINYDPALEALSGLNLLTITAEDYNSLKEGINDNLKDYIESLNGEYILHLGELLQHLDWAANGDWRSPIDAAYSLSGLISAATDNAKELILAKINATSKLADIYTYLLSIGEPFAKIAEFMMGPEFKVAVDFSDGNMMDSNTKWFKLEDSVKFVLDEETLPNVSNNVFMGLLANQTPDFNLLNEIFKLNDKDWFKIFQQDVAQNDPLLQSIGDLETYMTNLIREDKALSNGHTEAYNRLVKFIYSALKENLELDNILLDMIKVKVIEKTPVLKTDEFDPDMATFDEEFDEDYYGDVQEEEVYRAKSNYFNINTLKYGDWLTMYRYVQQYLIPKNQKLQGITNFNSLYLLKDKIVPALKEQRILSRILGINQGLKTKDFEEYKWIRDIEAFVNDRFLNAPSDTYQEFNLLTFLNPKEQKYHDDMIKAYENVKSTYNILDIIDSAKQFKAMLEKARDNRRLIEKAYILKVERLLADIVLRSNKEVKNGISSGLSQKLRENEFQVLKTFTQDLITANWLNTLGDVSIKLPYNRKSPVKYFDSGTELEFDPGNIFEEMDRDMLLNYIEQENLDINIDDNMSTNDIKEAIMDLLDENLIEYANAKRSVPLNSMDGIATFKWMMEHYIIPKLKRTPKYAKNSFIQSLQLSSKFDELTQREIEFYTLPMDLGNSSNNSDAEKTYNAFLADFNLIWNEDVPEELRISDENMVWTIGDLFYLYNLYVNKDGFGRNSLTRIFDNVVLSNDDNTLLYRYYDYICRLDSGITAIADVDNLSLDQENGSIDNLLTELRCALATQNGSKSRFRIELSNEPDSPAEYILYDQKYTEQNRIPLNRLDKNYFLFPFVTQYNPIKINDTSENARELNNRNARRFKIGGREAIEIIISAFQDTFGDKVKILAIDDSWFAQNSVPNKEISRNARGFIYNGVVYINVDKANLGTPIHELMHVVFAALKYGTKEQRDLYYKLVRETPNKFRDLEGPWKKYAMQVAKAYSGVAVGSDLREEITVHILSDLFASGYISAMGGISKDDEIEVTYRELQAQVYKAIQDVFKVTLPNMNEKRLNQKIMNMTLSQLLVDFSSSLFNFNTRLISQVNIPFNQKLAKFKADAANNWAEVNRKPALIIIGDC